MNTEKKAGIPLSKLLEPDGEIDHAVRDLKGKSGVVMQLTKYRNVEAMMGEKNADPKLRVALTKELLAARDQARERADRFPAGRVAGAVDARTKYIRELIGAHPTSKPLALWKVADKKRAGEKASFLKRASEYRNRK